jgi:hypothetical protein
MKTITIILMTSFIYIQFSVAQYKIPQSTLGAGGGQTSGGGHKIVGTIGQSAIGVAGNSLHMSQVGFWYQVGGFITGVEQLANEIPTEYKLEQNYPNPFNPTTTIRFSLPQQEHVTMTIYDVLGQEVEVLVNENCQAGKYTLILDARDWSSGAYIYRLQAGNFVDVKKLLLLK